MSIKTIQINQLISKWAKQNFQFVWVSRLFFLSLSLSGTHVCTYVCSCVCVYMCAACARAYAHVLHFSAYWFKLLREICFLLSWLGSIDRLVKPVFFMFTFVCCCCILVIVRNLSCFILVFVYVHSRVWGLIGLCGLNWFCSLCKQFMWSFYHIMISKVVYGGCEFPGQLVCGFIGMWLMFLNITFAKWQVECLCTRY